MSRGELTCVAYEEGGRELGRYSLRSAGEDTKLTLLPETEVVRAEGLGFIRLQYTDAQGIWKPMEKHSLKVEVENAAWRASEMHALIIRMVTGRIPRKRITERHW